MIDLTWLTLHTSCLKLVKITRFQSFPSNSVNSKLMTSQTIFFSTLTVSHFMQQLRSIVRNSMINKMSNNTKLLKHLFYDNSMSNKFLTTRRIYCQCLKKLLLKFHFLLSTIKPFQTSRWKNQLRFYYIPFLCVYGKISIDVFRLLWP